MSAMTLAEARTRVDVDFLDDDNTRWSTTEVDSALSAAMAYAFLECVSSGVDRFREVVSGTTSGTGTLDLSSYSPGMIHGVNVVQEARYPISATGPEDRQYTDDTARSVEVVLSRSPEVPTTTTHPLISDGSGNALVDDVSFNRLFAELVCARAASALSLKDGRVRQDLREYEMRMSGAIMQGVPARPRGKPLPFRKKRYYSSWLRYYYDPSTQEIVLHKLLWQ